MKIELQRLSRMDVKKLKAGKMSEDEIKWWISTKANEVKLIVRSRAFMKESEYLKYLKEIKDTIELLKAHTLKLVV